MNQYRSAMQQEIHELIDSKFKSRNFFQDSDDPETEEMIREEIKNFEEKYPDIVQVLANQLRIEFPSAAISNHTHFFSLDRCLRIIIEFSNQLRFICQISVFGYFSIYRAPLNKPEDGENRFDYDYIRFVDQHELDICDIIYASVSKCIPDLKWPDKSLLEEIVFRLTDIDSIDESIYNSLYNISVGCVLFTKFYG